MSAGSWRLRRRTGAAMLALAWSRMLIAVVPFRLWRTRLGLATASASPGSDPTGDALRLAIHVDRAASRLPFARKCLPRAMALSLLLRRADIPHCMVFAVRPHGHADAADRLHAWIERGATTVIGDLPGPWIEVLRVGDRISDSTR